MPILFFSLRDVPADEADDVRELLETNEIPYYETNAGNWGVSMPAIWLYNQQDLDTITPLFATYQQQRAVTQRQLYLALKEQGKNNSFLKHNLKKPLQFIIYSGIIGLILYVSLKWLFELGLSISF